MTTQFNFPEWFNVDNSGNGSTRDIVEATLKIFKYSEPEDIEQKARDVINPCDLPLFDLPTAFILKKLFKHNTLSYQL